jgi:hypothetical protein
MALEPTSISLFAVQTLKATIHPEAAEPQTDFPCLSSVVVASTADARISRSDPFLAGSHIDGLISPLSNPRSDQNIGSELDTRNQHDIGAKDRKRRPNDSLGSGPANGLGRVFGAKAGPASDHAHQETEDGRLEDCRYDVGKPEVHQ